MTQPQTSAALAVAFAGDSGGQPVEWRPHGPSSNMMITGGAGADVTAAARAVAIEAARQGADVRCCGFRPAGLAGLRGWPNITVAAGQFAVTDLVDRTWSDMKARSRDAGTAGDGRPMVLVADEMHLLALLLIDADGGARPGHAAPEALPVRQLRDILTGGAPARVSVVLAGNGDRILATVLGYPAPDLTGNCRTHLTLTGAQPRGPETCGLAGTVRTPGNGDRPVTVRLLPDPARYPAGLTAAERGQLLSKLPPGTQWGGPPRGGSR